MAVFQITNFFKKANQQKDVIKTIVPIKGKEILLNKKNRILGVHGDNKTNSVVFCLQRFFEGQDLGEFEAYAVFEGDVTGFAIENLSSEMNGEELNLKWEITPLVSSNSEILFQLRLQKENDNETLVWQTHQASFCLTEGAMKKEASSAPPEDLLSRAIKEAVRAIQLSAEVAKNAKSAATSAVSAAEHASLLDEASEKAASSSASAAVSAQLAFDLSESAKVSADAAANSALAAKISIEKKLLRTFTLANSASSVSVSTRDDGSPLAIKGSFSVYISFPASSKNANMYVSLNNKSVSSGTYIAFVSNAVQTTKRHMLLHAEHNGTFWETEFCTNTQTSDQAQGNSTGLSGTPNMVPRLAGMIENSTVNKIKFEFDNDVMPAESVISIFGRSAV